MKKTLLVIDGAVNLLLGALLLLFPWGMGEWLGLPPVKHHFYATLLGGVIFGIGVALVIESRWGACGIRGLGLAGAIAINLCGGGVLLAWLVAGHLTMPPRGQVLLWSIAAIVLGLGLIELFCGPWKEK